MIALTPEQSQMLRAAVLIVHEKVRAGEKGAKVNTVELAGRTGRVGQVVGLICSGLVNKGMLERANGRHYYKLTPAGLAQLQAELAEVREAREQLTATAPNPKRDAVEAFDAEIAAEQAFDRARR